MNPDDLTFPTFLSLRRLDTLARMMDMIATWAGERGDVLVEQEACELEVLFLETLKAAEQTVRDR